MTKAELRALLTSVDAQDLQEFRAAVDEAITQAAERDALREHRVKEAAWHALNIETYLAFFETHDCGRTDNDARDEVSEEEARGSCGRCAVLYLDQLIEHEEPLPDWLRVVLSVGVYEDEQRAARELRAFAESMIVVAGEHNWPLNYEHDAIPLRMNIAIPGTLRRRLLAAADLLDPPQVADRGE
jgi:hypothetical protein